MKTSIHFFLACALFLPPCNSQGEEAAIVEIRDQYNRIEALKMESTTINFELQDDPLAGKISIYREGGQVRKIVIESGAEHGGSTESFYFSNGELFFAFVEETMWRFSGNTLPDGQSETVDSLTELRVYFEDGKCIRALTREAKSADPEALGKLILEVPNQPFTMADEITAIKEKGVALLGLGAVFG